ncbi:MAG: cytochrome c [Bacteroidetes bacterium]|nr:cytochrome c [Bacteroidota bacterium]MBS1757626.1 cytochrome c [Bacteroidota bacterium]
MKHKISIAAIILVAAIFTTSSCDSKREPGKVYMPDMAYSRAYESYAEHDSIFTREVNDKGGKLIFYNEMAPDGTIKRGELFPDNLTNDSTGYNMSALVKNPLGNLSKEDMEEAARLFNINCAICHGEKGTASGPLSSKIGGIANLTLPNYVEMADGTMFHSITYGKNNMGSYASQVSRKQRWMIIKYIRTLQPKTGAATKTDSAIVAKK